MRLYEIIYKLIRTKRRRYEDQYWWSITAQKGVKEENSTKMTGNCMGRTKSQALCRPI